MKKNDIIVEKTFDAPVAKVWEAITNKEQMKQWYFDIADFKPEVGFEFQFRGTGKEGESYIHLCTIKEVVFQKKLVYSWRYDGHGGNSLVTFELFEEAAKTRLRLTHEGLDTFPQMAAFVRENFVEGWTYLIQKSLKEFVEKG